MSSSESCTGCLDKPLISLIVATLDRCSDVDRLLDSLTRQVFKEFEVILIDQSKDTNTQKVVEKYGQLLNIRYVRIAEAGTSNARNIGIGFAQGDIKAFPDDDCLYYPETLTNVNYLFNKHKNADIIVGKVCDIDGNNLLRKWPKTSRKMTRFNFYFMFSAVSLFSRSSGRFDVEFGPGSIYGAAEDADYLYKEIKNGLCLYSPEIKVYHAEEKTDRMPIGKVKNYSMGLGAFCKKNLEFPIVILFMLSLLYITFCLLLAMLNKRENEYNLFKMGLTMRIKGFLSYKRG
ncbi:Glycosyltransferase involved in cell wall bisynthesis [Pelosinus fermentans]|uniref:glycosyltransferase family 2 protein n=1 Tax=Pelosinus fermentans TaxID=365349 RepID=UPI0002685DA3|nr:glycosyltransferase family 2 protein [Pelosinus fermentans]OAM92796.1 glycosyl transferase family 2 [Pelosinus fermentans DSM 17108]SDQ57134.1 Glycosyltransferase involved in cell wall bisynthesis [Pelosinus fermentans]